MKGRVALVLLFATTGLQIAHAGARELSPEALLATEAIVTATWLEPTRQEGRYRWFDAEVLQHQDPATGELQRRGSISTGSCRAQKQPSGTTGFACSGPALRVTKKDHFEVVPDGTSATLRVRRGSRLWVVRWTTEEIRGTYLSGTECRRGGGVARAASATARFEGRRLTTDKEELEQPARIWHGLSAGSCELPPSVRRGSATTLGPSRREH